MSENYVPEVGDRVRVVIEGEQSDGVRGFKVMTGSDLCATIRVDRGYSISVEKVAPPLPTTPDSVIRSKILGSVWHLHTDGKWHAADGSTSRGWSYPERFEVIFDAGAAK